MDAVKDEQNRAREVGRSARGGHVSGAKGKSLYAASTHFNALLGGRGGPTRGSDILSSLHHLTGIGLRSRSRGSSTWWAWAWAGYVTLSVQLSAFPFNALRFYIKSRTCQGSSGQAVRSYRSNNYQIALVLISKLERVTLSIQRQRSFPQQAVNV